MCLCFLPNGQRKIVNRLNPSACCYFSAQNIHNGFAVIHRNKIADKNYLVDSTAHFAVKIVEFNLEHVIATKRVLWNKADLKVSLN